jgi:hypothetical protein
MFSTKLRKAAAAAVAVLLAIAALDDSNVVGQIARKAVEVIGTVFGFSQ